MEQNNVVVTLRRPVSRRPPGASKLGQGEPPLRRPICDVEISPAPELSTLFDVLGGDIYYKVSGLYSERGRIERFTAFTKREELPKLVLIFRILARPENAQIRVRKPSGISVEELQLKEGELVN